MILEERLGTIYAKLNVRVTQVAHAHFVESIAQWAIFWLTAGFIS